VNLFTAPAYANCASQFVGFETQCMMLETIDWHTKQFADLPHLFLHKQFRRLSQNNFTRPNKVR